MLPLTSTIAMSDRISRYVNKADARHAATEMLNDQGKIGRGESVGFFELLAYLCLDGRLARFCSRLGKGKMPHGMLRGFMWPTRQPVKLPGAAPWGATSSIGVCCIPSRRS